MKTARLITTLCLFTIFWAYPQNESKKIEELTEKIIDQEIKAAFFKPGAITEIGMYGAAVLVMIRISPLAWGIYNKVSMSQREIETTIKNAANFMACALIAKIIRSCSRSLQEICLSRKKAYEKQLELIAAKRAL